MAADAGTAPPLTPPSPGLAWAVRLLPLAVGIPVVAAVVVSVGRVLGTRHPYLGWAIAIASDAKAVALGALPYGDPAEAYTGLLYAPGFPLLLAPLYRLFWWDGWPLLLSMGAGCVLAGTAGVLAIEPRDRSGRERGIEAAVAVGVAGVAWWTLTANPYHMLDEGRGDHVAWLFALLGLVAVARVAAGASSRTWPAVALLTAAVWTKQTTVVAVVAALAALLFWAVRGAVDRRTVLRFVGGLAVVNLLLLGALQVATDGWGWFFLVTLPGRHWRDPAVLPYVRELRDFVLLAVVLAAGAGIGAVLGRGGVRHLLRDVATPSSWRRALVVLLVLFLVVAFVPAVEARRKQGGSSNQYIGIQWALVFLFALAYRTGRRTRVGAVVLTVTLGLAGAVAHWEPARRLVHERGVAVASAYAPAEVEPVPPELVEMARTERVYLPWAGDLNAERLHEVWPTEQNIVDLYAAGTSPGRLVEALLDQRFDIVAMFDTTSDPYASAYGRTEENVLWKLNRIIASGYEPLDPDGTVLGRRAAGVAEPWLRTCFGPFDLGATEWAPGAGGGLWCRHGPAAVALEETPAARSQLRATGLRRARGELTVVFRSGQGTARVLVGHGRQHTAVALTVASDGRTVRADVTRAGGTRTSADILVVQPGRVAVTLAFEDGHPAPGRLPVGASPGRGVVVEADAETKLLVDAARLRAAD